MSLKPFTYPFPETRFLHAGPNVYKFKIRYGKSIRGEEIENKEVITQELEDSVRVVLGNLDNLQPFATEHFIVFPYKSKWERVSHLKFKHGEIILIPYPFVFTLYVEMKWFHENLSPGKPISDSPLGLLVLKVAFGSLRMGSFLHCAFMNCEQLWKGGVTGICFLLKVPVEKKAVGAVMRKRKHMDEPSSPSRPGLDRAKIGTSSQGPSKKKPPVETRRNRERKTQQGLQETLASDITDVQKQDSEWGHSLPGRIVPPLQHNSPPPKERAATGFFGFLSSLFPFRYFFRKSSHS
ncbi:membrane-anchored junction protein isoform X1 [Homo sapiens]|uniref:MAJIN n=1 Tax=Homo sapiens TaxID=9606 RepID=A0A0P0YTB5_HUMAN|nr:membrane-anchored junction protein isoform X1 [Homo sapiens]XP_047282752.1 membrane-anchored junction protein isoform X1 [Homo sapiens]XP_047282753.1 membrane-anchored junction protein isoform X1 [Homo sapiens]XP_054224440.1 membrane-anchored junction protein isoform X1 [Homo sapiens]XP_054224441.1 membrane-anchored junction protein isoform X1 [Homo sapiens]XP_054224442.1 membrane-anchored junction protein isoform X1 [Homo sapiens]BAT24490.1 MAJIN [Homo sapiens]